MNLAKVIISFITFLLTTSVLLDNSFSALGTGTDSFMDLESSVKELRSLINKNSPGIVSVAVYDETGVLRNSGSGFFIDNEGRIVTNASIWKDAYSAEVLSDSNSYSEVLVLNRNENIDIALIKIKAANEIPLELDFNYENNLGERVIVIGKLNGQVNTVSEGVISSFLKTEENLKLIEIQTAVSILHYQNSKDGPVLNTTGKVIGVASNTIFDRNKSDGNWRGFNNDQMYAVSLQSVKSLLSESGHIEYLHRAKSKVWVSWFVSSLKSMVLTGFLYFYDIGFSKLIVLLFVIIIISYIFELLYSKYIKPKYGR
jgi:S1-C subfamily serine protease